MPEVKFCSTRNLGNLYSVLALRLWHSACYIVRTGGKTYSNTIVAVGGFSPNWLWLVYWVLDPVSGSMILGEGSGISCDLATQYPYGPHGPIVFGKSIKIGLEIFPHYF